MPRMEDTRSDSEVYKRTLAALDGSSAAMAGYQNKKIQFPCNHGEKVRSKGCEEPAACLVCPYRLRF
eukprot:4924058-Amphidinium_carterae.1